MWNLKKLQQSSKHKRNCLIDIENWGFPKRRRERVNIGAGKWGAQTSRHKIGSGMCCTTWGIQPIFCNNCKWKVTFKNCIKKRKNLLLSYTIHR